MFAPTILISGSAAGCENYCRAIAAVGGIPIPSYCPSDPLAALRTADGLVLAGGPDMEPHYYGQENHGSRTLDPDRDAAELSLTCAFLRAQKPILAICRGMQLLNVVCGGDLLQAMEEPLCAHHDQAFLHDQLHPTTIRPGSYLHALYGARAVVNTAHHQAVTRLGTGLLPCQWSDDGIVEGVVHTTLPVFGVQWHPERLCLSFARQDAVDGLRLFRFFAAQCL